MGNLREVGNKADVGGDIKKIFGCKLPPIEQLQRPQKKGSRFVASSADLYSVFGNEWL
jgi:hypothetical protein